jgi:hypothetical protein
VGLIFLVPPVAAGGEFLYNKFWIRGVRSLKPSRSGSLLPAFFIFL